LPLLILITAILAAVKKVDIFSAFIEGAKQGVNTVLSIFPTLCALFFVIGIFNTSGAQSVTEFALHPVASFIGLPDAVIPLMILRPLSGSGAMAFFKTLLVRFGINSPVTRIASVMLGSSETTLYTVSVYYGAAGVKKTRHTIPCALLGDITAFIMSAVAVSIFFK